MYGVQWTRMVSVLTLCHNHSLHLLLCSIYAYQISFRIRQGSIQRLSPSAVLVSIVCLSVPFKDTSVYERRRAGGIVVS